MRSGRLLTPLARREFRYSDPNSSKDVGSEPGLLTPPDLQLILAHLRVLLLALIGLVMIGWITDALTRRPLMLAP
jgi:hypothetical protein